MELLQKIDAAQNPKSYLLSIALRLWKNHKKKYATRKRIADMESLTEEQQEIEETVSFMVGLIKNINQNLKEV